jgi:alkaline phosphatase D
MTVDRRRAMALLGLGAAGAPTAAAAQRRRGRGGPEAPAVRYLHGVASGDPSDNSAVLWTRITPEGAVDGPIEVFVEVSTSRGMGRMEQENLVRTDASRDYTVKYNVSGLEPGKEYYYRFRVGKRESPVGRFRTLPTRAEDVVLAVVSCSLHPGGLFNAYDAIARLQRVDAVVHLGDYIYEYGAGDTDYGVSVGKQLSRLPQPPREITTLEDYRLRHAQYKSDPDLQAAHARAAWITVWDDHETANDSWIGGAENHSAPEGDWAARKANALKAYYEWMPIREGGAPEMINRTFRFADVATLHMVETRLTARSQQLDYAKDLTMGAAGPDLEGFRRKLNNSGRTLLGEAQMADLARAVDASVRAGVTWQVLGNQVVMARVNGPNLVQAAGQAQVAAMIGAVEPGIRPRLQAMSQLFQLGVPMNLDAWDGYPAERERLYGFLKGAKARPIVLAGDSHAFWVNDLKDAAGQRVGAEFGTTSVTSPGFGDVIKGVDLGKVIADQNDEVIFSDQGAKGFTVLRLTKQEAVGELTAVSTITAKPYQSRVLKRFRVQPLPGGGVSPPQEA